MCPLKMEGMDEMNLFNYLIIINTNRKDILPKEKWYSTYFWTTVNLPVEWEFFYILLLNIWHVKVIQS